MSGINKTSTKGSSGAGTNHSSAHGGGEHHGSSAHGHSSGAGHAKSQGGHEHGHGAHGGGHSHAAGHGGAQSHGATAAHGTAQSHGVGGAGGASAAHKGGDRFEVKAPTPGASHGGQTGSNPFVAHPQGAPDLNTQGTRHPGQDSGKQSGGSNKDDSPEV